MIKIAIVGAGSLTFTRWLVMDILAVQELRDTHFHFMDIDPEGLETAVNLCRKMAALGFSLGSKSLRSPSTGPLALLD